MDKKVYFVFVDGDPKYTYLRRDAATRKYYELARMVKRGALRVVHELRMCEKTAGTLISYF